MIDGQWLRLHQTNLLRCHTCIWDRNWSSFGTRKKFSCFHRPSNQCSRERVFLGIKRSPGPILGGVPSLELIGPPEAHGYHWASSSSVLVHSKHPWSSLRPQWSKDGVLLWGDRTTALCIDRAKGSHKSTPYSDTRDLLRLHRRWGTTRKFTIGEAKIPQFVPHREEFGIQPDAVLCHELWSAPAQSSFPIKQLESMTKRLYSVTTCPRSLLYSILDLMSSNSISRLLLQVTRGVSNAYSHYAIGDSIFEEVFQPRRNLTSICRFQVLDPSYWMKILPYNSRPLSFEQYSTGFSTISE